jgi:peptidylprolyl isomerase
MITQRIALTTLALTLIMGAACGEDSGSSDGGSDAGAQPPDVTEFVCPDDAIDVTDGLCYVEHEVGQGPEAEEGDVVEVDYTGTLNDGTVFDSSEGRGPLEFTLGVGQVIPGWDEGIAGMAVGGSRTLTIQSDLAYGEAGFPPDIPANATLTFDVELVSIKSPKSGKG